MKQLSEECIKAIHNEIDESVSNRNDMILGCYEALTNPEIYTKADLISKEEMFEFVEWAMNVDFEIDKNITPQKVFTLYQQTK